MNYYQLFTLMFKTYPEVFSHYLEKSQQIVKKTDCVLKTDCYNELVGTPKKGGIVGNLDCDDVRILEFDEEKIKQTKKILPKLYIRQGDIRKIPYNNCTLDVVLDLSTLDHIPPEDVAKAIREYHRILKDKGKLFLVVWIDPLQNATHVKWEPMNQYFFDANLVLAPLKEYFKITESNRLLELEDGKYLQEFVCEKFVPWDYLREEATYNRYKIVADYLHNKIDNAIVVDIDCGMADLINYLPKTFHKYIANDIYSRPIYHPKMIFYPQSDHIFISVFKEQKVDILIALGIGAGHINKSIWESPTLDACIRDILYQYEPKYVVLESAKQYEEKYHMMNDLVQYAKTQKYSVDSEYSFKTKSDIPIAHDRHIIFLKR
jgi:hypothetical protein